jgi:hypothetical protein|uniref:Uncharacterized protein n=1 Tax=viral metagenome TaxID=1070528 RepID=A0A6C0K4X7_9ZZZZ
MTGYSYLLYTRNPESYRNNNKSVIPHTKMNLITILITSIIFSSLIIITIILKNPIASYICTLGYLAFAILIINQSDYDSDTDSEIESESEAECDEVDNNKSPKENKDD